VQAAVRAKFEELQKIEGSEKWKVVDAGQSVDQVQEEVWGIVQEAIEKVNKKPALGKLWQAGTIDISDLRTVDDKENRARSLL
jgi:hypothetical protein